jgi:acyl-CoA thioesterase I
MRVRSGAKILFQGDSITDADRDYFDPSDLGRGYVRMVAEEFIAKYPEVKPVFLNRGVSGDRVRDLKRRWQIDCLSLKPDVVSILIGINDTLGTFFWDEPTSLESFEADYASILEFTRRSLDARIVLLEPFLLPVSNELLALRSDVDSRIKVVKKLALEFETDLVELDQTFLEASEKESPKFWSVDGVHPTIEGHALIAQNWLISIE